MHAVSEQDTQGLSTGLQKLVALDLRQDDSMVSTLLTCLREILDLRSARVRIERETQGPLVEAVGEPAPSAPSWDLPIGPEPRLGTLTCTSLRAGFPTIGEQMLMQLAAHKLALAVQESRARVAQRASATRLERDRLARSLGLKQLLSTVAHEINQPLAAIVSNANACARWLAHDPPNAAEALAAVQRIPREAERASGLVARAREVTHSGTASREVIEVAALLHEVAQNVREEAVRRNVSVRVLSGEESLVLGDRAELEQLLYLLIDNAFEAMAERTSFRVLTLRVDSVLDGSVLISVHDTGPGLTAEQHERVFAPLSSSKPGRLGLGLSIGRAIAHSLRGKLSSAPSASGATFCLTIPRHTP